MAGAVLFQSKARLLSIIFAMISLFLGLWSLPIGILSYGFFSPIALYSMKLSVLAGIPIPFLTLLFSDIFLKGKFRYSLSQIVLLGIPVIVFVAFIPGEVLLSPSYDAVARTYTYGLMLTHLSFVAYFVSYLAWAGIKFYSDYKVAQNFDKMRYKYFFLGVVLAATIAVLFNLVLVSFGVYELIFFGPLGTVFLVGFTAYSILRYRLMDVNLIFKKTTAYSLVTTSIAFTYILIVLSFEYAFRYYYGYSAFWHAVPAALVIAVTFNPLRNYLQAVTDRIFFRQIIEYQRIIKEVTHLISSVTNLNTLFRLVDRTIARAFCVEAVAIALYEENGDSFRIEKTNGHGEELTGHRISPDSPLVHYLLSAKDVAVADEVRALRERDLIDEEKGKMDKIIAELEFFKAVIAVPAFSRDRLVGILFLGEKLSGEAYSPDDLDLLLNMASEAGIAIENAKLYRDITQTRDYLNNLIQKSGDAIVTLDTEGRVTSYNQGAANSFGYEEQEVLGRRPFGAPEGDFQEVVERVLRGEEVLNMETHTKHKDGSNVPLLLTASPVHDPDGATIGVFVIMKNIAELKKVDVMKNEFLSIVSHELRTPLTPIKGYLSLLLHGQMGQISPKQKEALETIMNQSNHLQDLLDSVIDLSRIEAGKPPVLEKEPLFIRSIVDETLNSVRSEFEIKGVKLTVNSEQEPVAIMGDRKKLLRLVANLLENGLKFTPSGGEAVITLGKDDRSIKFEIADTGIGLEAKNLHKIFDRFYQVDSSYTRQAGGIGMGLAIAKEIVEAHGGRIWGESDGLGHGARFFFTLPISEKA